MVFERFSLEKRDEHVESVKHKTAGMNNSGRSIFQEFGCVHLILRKLRASPRLYAGFTPIVAGCPVISSTFSHSSPFGLMLCTMPLRALVGTWVISPCQ